MLAAHAPDADAAPAAAADAGAGAAADATASSSSAAAAAAGGEGVAYRLRALVAHHGESCAHGHYTCLARLADSEQWASYDDSDVQLLERDPIADNTVSRGAYLLLYERVDEQPPAAAAATA